MPRYTRSNSVCYFKKLCYNKEQLNVAQSIGENMSDAIAPEGAVESKLEADQPQVTEAQPLADGAETSVAKDDTLLNNVADKTTEASTTSEDIDWKKRFEDQQKKHDAESKRKREKNKKLTEKLKRAEGRLEELEGQKTTLESVGNDYDALQRAEQRYEFKILLAEEKLNDARLDAQDIEPVSGENEVRKAAENYNTRVRASYLSSENAVSENALLAKEALINDALALRSYEDQAFIISEINALENPIDAVIAIANDPEKLYKLADKSLTKGRVAQVLYEASKKPKQASNAPEPVPELDGSTGSAVQSFDKSTVEGLKASLKAQGINI